MSTELVSRNLDARYLRDNPIRLLEGVLRGNPRAITSTLHSANEAARNPMGQEEAIIADLVGPGTVSEIYWATTDGKCDNWRLRIYTDGNDLPDVDAELGTLFGGRGLSTSTALTFQSVHAVLFQPGATQRQGSWMMTYPIPFGSRCRITLYNPDSTSIQNGLWTTVTWVPGVTSPYRLRSSGLATFFNGGTYVDASNDLLLASTPAGNGYVAHISLTGWDAGGTGSGTWQERDLMWYSHYTSSTPVCQGTGVEDAWRGGFYLYPASTTIGYATATTMTGGRVLVKDCLAQWGGLPYSNGFKIVFPTENAVKLGSTHSGLALYYEDSASVPAYVKETTAIQISELPSDLEAYYDFNLDHWASCFVAFGLPHYIRSCAGNPVSFTFDQTGRGHSLQQNTPSHRPVMIAVENGGQTALTSIKASAPWLNTVSTSQIVLGDFDVMFVGSLAWGTDSRGILANGNLQGITGQHCLRIGANGQLHTFDNVVDAYSSANYSSIVPQGALAVFEFARVGATCSWFVNGQQLGSDVVGGSGQMVMDTIERWSGVPQDPTVRDATLVWSRKLTPAERASTVSLIREKYGIP